MFTYAAFINELGPLIAKAKGLKDRPALTDDKEFRRWRHELSNLIARIEAKKYKINCEVAYRNFDEHGTYTYSPSRHERISRYNRDLEDTITELETLRQHATVTLWLQALGLLLAVFSAGVVVGQSALYAEVVNKLLPLATQASSPSPAPSKR